MKPIILIGYGNPDRQDDGVAWHILRAVAVRLGLQPPASYDDEFPLHPKVDFSFTLQLTPEMAEDIVAYQRVCFIDAHTGNIPELVRIVPLKSVFQHSPFTHHLTPESLLSMADIIYHTKPEAALLSVRGFRFGFTRELSAETGELLPDALESLMAWLGDDLRQ